MQGVGREVFGGDGTGPRIIFEGAPETKYGDGFYIVTDGFLLPMKMVRQVFVSGGFILKPECSIVENTVLNERNEECVMIRCNDLKLGTVEELLIPRHILYKVVKSPREAYPSKWE